MKAFLNYLIRALKGGLSGCISVLGEVREGLGVRSTTPRLENVRTLVRAISAISGDLCRASFHGIVDVAIR